MKKFNNKKGFTIVELVIVIAVIGILAGVLIPTFSGIVQRANESKINQEMTNALKVVLAGNATSGALADGTTFVMSQKKDDKNVAAYYAKYNGNKFDKIVTINDKNTLATDSFNRVIIGTSKEENAPYDTIAEEAISYLFGKNSVEHVDTTNPNKHTLCGLTVLSNSDLSAGMFVLVPSDDNNSTVEKVKVTVNGTDIFEGGKVEVEVTKGATVVNVIAKEGFTLESGKTIKAGDSGNVAYAATTRTITITVTSAINAETTITLTVE